MELNWLPEIQSALDRIYERHEAFQFGAGDRVMESIRTRVLKLADYPYLGRMVPEVGLQNLREVVVPPYRILYLVVGTRIDLLTIFHGALDLNLDE